MNDKMTKMVTVAVEAAQERKKKLRDLRAAVDSGDPARVMKAARLLVGGSDDEEGDCSSSGEQRRSSG